MNSWAQEWVWRWSKARGLPKFVLLAIVRRATRFLRDGNIETPELPAKQLIKDTGLTKATIQRQIARLVGATDSEIEVIKSSRRGDAHRYRLRRSLRLPFERDEGVVRASERGLTSISVSPDAGDRLPGDRASERGPTSISVSTDTGDLAEFQDPGGAAAMHGSSSSSSSSDPDRSDHEDRSDDDRDRRSLQAAQRFLTETFAPLYAAYHGGARVLFTKKDIRDTHGLLQQLPEPELHAMVQVLMSPITPEEDRWLSRTTERGVKLLVYAASALHRIAVQRAQRASDNPPPIDAETVWAKICARAGHAPELVDVAGSRCALNGRELRVNVRHAAFEALEQNGGESALRAAAAAENYRLKFWFPDRVARQEARA